MIAHKIIKPLEPTDKKKYVDLGNAGPDTQFTVSQSGKAVLLGKPRHVGDQWYPLSILRLGDETGYGASVLCPVWFLRNNGIEY